MVCQFVTGFGMTPPDRFPVPGGGFMVVLGNTHAFVVHEAQVEHAIDIVLLGGLLEPKDGLGEIPGPGRAFDIHAAQPDLGGDMPLFGKRAEFVKGGEVVAALVRRDRRMEVARGTRKKRMPRITLP